MKNITEQEVKELVNGLIDLKNDTTYSYNDHAAMMRSHGIEMAIGRINSKLLNQSFRSENKKYELPQPKLKLA